MRKYIIIAFLTVVPLSLSAQQIPSTSQYYFNHYTMNPAATGTSDFLPLSFSYRKIWTGIDQSPSVIYFSGEMAVAKSMGAGVKFYNYSAGPLRKTGVELTYSYHIEFNPEMHLAFGLSGMFYQFHLAKSDLTFQDPNDPIQMSGEEQMIVPDVSFGSYFYGKNYFVGLAVPHLVNRNIDLKSDNILQEKQVRHYYLFGGYDFEVNPDLKIKPSMLVKFIEAGLFQVDLNVQVEYREAFIGEISFRSSDALVFLLGFRYDDILIGYSYDLAIGTMRGNTFGSHEVFLQYKLPNFIQRGRY